MPACSPIWRRGAAEVGPRPNRTDENGMAKVATLIWIMLGITFAGILGTIILAVPSLSQESAETLPWAALLGFVLAIPASIVIAKKILEETNNR